MKFRYLGLFALAPVLSQCQPACAPIPDGDPVGENAPPPVEEVVPAPVETAAAVTVPTTQPAPVTTLPAKPSFEDDLIFGFNGWVYGNCFSGGGSIGWNASTTDAYTTVDLDVTILDADTGAVVATLTHRIRHLPMSSDDWMSMRLPVARAYVAQGKMLFTGPGVNPVTITVYSDEFNGTAC